MFTILFSPVENGLLVVLWVGQHVSNNILSDLFGMTAHSQVDPSMVRPHPLIITINCMVGICCCVHSTCCLLLTAKLPLDCVD